jgi:hypothetical protein
MAPDVEFLGGCTGVGGVSGVNHIVQISNCADTVLAYTKNISNNYE